MAAYKVLWLEDEIKKVEGFFDLADLHDIDLIHVETVSEFKKRLENIKDFDAAILDAKGVVESLDEIPSLKSVAMAISRIDELKGEKVLPYFVLSGQLGDGKNNSAKEMLDTDNIYIKAKDEEALIEKLKAEADQQKETQIRHEHQSFFDIAETYDPQVKKTILEILLGVKHGAGQFSDEHYFTSLRSILEHLFRKANDVGLLHDACVDKGNNNQVNLVDSAYFLSGEYTLHCGVTCAVSHFPRIIATNVKNLLNITGAASHTSHIDDKNNVDVNLYRKNVSTPYLLYSLAFQLMDVFIWFDQYSAENPDYATNKSHWQTIPEGHFTRWHHGYVHAVKPNGWVDVHLTKAVYKASIHPEVAGGMLKDGDSIQVELKSPIAQNIN